MLAEGPSFAAVAQDGHPGRMAPHFVSNENFEGNWKTGPGSQLSRMGARCALTSTQLGLTGR